MGRRVSVLEETVQKFTKMGITAMNVQGDVRDFASCSKAVETVVEKFGKLDILGKVPHSSLLFFSNLPAMQLQ
jgi:NADP-dependent 3-hydroxy acid dehydrogenase YdfG